MMGCKNFCLVADYDLNSQCDYKTENRSISVEPKWLSRHEIMMERTVLRECLLVRTYR
jgi:hypothetical protein